MFVTFLFLIQVSYAQINSTQDALFSFVCNVDTLPIPVIFAEPEFTKGRNNIVRVDVTKSIANLDFIVKESYVFLQITSDGKSTEKPVRFDIRNEKIIADTIWTFDGDTLQHGKKYSYAAKIFIIDNNSISHCSEYTNPVSSTQDTIPPEVDFSLDTTLFNKMWLDRKDFTISGFLQDNSGVSEAVLYRRSDSTAHWDSVDAEFFGKCPDFPLATNVVFEQTVPTDGHYEFLIRGRDGTHAPESDASNWVCEGNFIPPDVSTLPDTVIIIDTTPPPPVTPKCEQIKTSIQLRWVSVVDAGVGLEKYWIYKDGEYLDSVQDIRNSQVYYTDTKFENNVPQTFEYQVLPVDSLGNKDSLEKAPKVTFIFTPPSEIKMVPEPEFTAGLSNTVCWSTIGEFDSFKVFIREFDNPARTDSVSIPGTLRCHPFDSLENGVKYEYWVKGIDIFGNLVLSDTTSSTQDNEAPLVEITSQQNCLSPETENGLIKIPFCAKDLISGAVDSAILFTRTNITQAWIPIDTLDLDEMAGEVCSTFSVKILQGGHIEFSISAKDTTWSPDNSGRQGNVGIGDSTTIFILQPEVKPGNGQFVHASEIDSLLIAFNESVTPKAGFKWSEIITVENKYACFDSLKNVKCSFANETATVKNIKFRLEPFVPAGWYEARVDLGKVNVNDIVCDPGDQNIFKSDFYTYMELDGGQVCSPAVAFDVKINVPENTLSAPAVFSFADAGRPECYINEQPSFKLIADVAKNVVAFKDDDRNQIVGIEGDVTLRYTSVPSGIVESSLRLFKHIIENGSDICVIGGKTNCCWDQNSQEKTVMASFDDITGLFFIMAEEENRTVSKDSVLSNYPNPFGVEGSETTITYYLQQASLKVSLRIFDQFGNLVKTFHDLSTQPGLNVCSWDGTNDRSEKVANGGYIGVLDVDGKKYRRKIAVMR